MKKLSLLLFTLIALVGLNANAAIYLVGNEPFGQGWEPNKGVEMINNGDTAFTFAATINGTIWFVMADDLADSGDWTTFNNTMRIGPTAGDETVTAGEWTTTQKAGGDNGAYKFTGTGDEYTITYVPGESKFMIEGYVEEPPIIEDNYYTVAGSPASLFGQEWAPGFTDNDMTLVDGLYTWSKENVELSEGSIAFKVVVNHSWGEAYPSSNYVHAIEKHGYYDVLITFDAETKAVNCTTTLLEEIVGPEEHTYTVAGTANLCGSDWSATDESNDMVKGEDGLYTWEKKNVALAKDEEVKFKVVKDHSWAVSYPADNYPIAIEQTGNYDIKITFDADSNTVSAEATLLEEVEDFYVVAGAPAALFGEEWKPALEENKMTLTEDGIYIWTKENVELTPCNVEFKVVMNGIWSTSWPENNYVIQILDAGTYNAYIYFNPETYEVTAAINKVSGGDTHYTGDVYVMGEVNDNGGWFTNVGAKMTANSDYTYTLNIHTAGENIPENEETGYSYFGFTKQLAEEADAWDEIAPYRFGAISEGDFWVTDEVLGTELPLTTVNYQSFRVPAGQWILKVSVDNMTLVITDARGDVDRDAKVTIADVTALIDILLTGVEAPGEADCDKDGVVSIADVTTLIDYLLSGHWPATE